MYTIAHCQTPESRAARQQRRRASSRGREPHLPSERACRARRKERFSMHARRFRVFMGSRSPPSAHTRCAKQAEACKRPKLKAGGMRFRALTPPHDGPIKFARGQMADLRWSQRPTHLVLRQGTLNGATSRGYRSGPAVREGRVEIATWKGQFDTRVLADERKPLAGTCPSKLLAISRPDIHEREHVVKTI